MPLPWFRRKQRQSAATIATPFTELAPEDRPLGEKEVPSSPTLTAEPEPGEQAAKPNRRRGSRGGRNRRKPQRDGARDRGGAEAGAAGSGSREGREGPEGRQACRRPAAKLAEPPPPGVAPRAAPGREARAARLGRRHREAGRRAGGRPRRRGLPRAAGAPVDRREHLQGRGRQRPAGDGGGVRRDRPREERLPVRRRDRRPRARGPTAARPPDHRPDQSRRAGARAGRQGPDEDEGGAADDRDLAPGPLRRLRSARRGPRRLAPARRGRAQPPARHRQGDRSQAGRRDRPHGGGGRLGGGRPARPRVPDEALEADPDAREGVAAAEPRVRGGRAATARHSRPVHRRLRAGAWSTTTARSSASRAT